MPVTKVLRKRMGHGQWNKRASGEWRKAWRICIETLRVTWLAVTSAERPGSTGAHQHLTRDESSERMALTLGMHENIGDAVGRSRSSSTCSSAVLLVRCVLLQAMPAIKEMRLGVAACVR